ncbi:purine-cytosine permease family protein [Cohnella nanjingensis]|uniref:Cytosine permease n=1 Tax=Cohnella nanjingensis TaxID=1387779 RepID=A0A7X0S007_9BACL|nr:cytosine permease [Cohnella nanjingensis]MBB6675661.1 cytosine permease [Cohnella nanjingensis]
MSEALKNTVSAGSAGVEDYSITAVPGDERKSVLNIAVTCCAWIISMSTLFAGGALASGLTFGQSLLAGALGMLILAVIGFFQGWMGAKYGVSTTVLARHAFGRAGAGLFGLVLSITLGIGWFAWQIAFFGLTIEQMFPDAWFADHTVAMVWGGILMLTTAFIGYKGLAAISFIAVPLVFILSIWGIVAAVDHAGSFDALLHAQPSSGTGMTLFAGITLVVGNAALGAVVFPDITRYGKTPLKGGLGASLGYFLGGLFCVGAGAAITLAAQVPGLGSTPNIPAAMAQIGLGFFAFLILVFAQWTTNDNNLYTGALGLRNVVKLPKFVLVLAMGLAGIAIAVVGIQDQFVPFLNTLGTYVPPIAGIMVADHWIVGPYIRRSPYRFGPGTEYATINFVAILVVVLAGFIASKLSFGIGPINAVVIGFAGYVAIVYLFRLFHIPYSIGNRREDASGF